VNGLDGRAEKRSFRLAMNRRRHLSLSVEVEVVKTDAGEPGSASVIGTPWVRDLARSLSVNADVPGDYRGKHRVCSNDWAGDVVDKRDDRNIACPRRIGGAGLIIEDR